jgi:hypothetical protein
VRLAFVCLLAASAGAQSLTQRGFLETSGVFYPQTAPGDRGRGVGQALLRYEAFYKLTPELQFSGGLDARADTHHEVERTLHLGWQDRQRQRPALAVRRLSAGYHRGRLSLEVGKQFVRWGKADVLTPTDRFAPRDFLNVVDNDFLAITAARLTYGSASDTLDVVWSPRFTPSRVPLLTQRWVVLPEGVPIGELAPRFPGGSQAGARWNHIGKVAEYSVSFYDGRNHLPLLEPSVQLNPPRVNLQRTYPRMRMYGGDVAVPLRAVTVKAETAYFTSTTPATDDYVLYVVQLERQAGEWFFIGGYAGQVITERRGTLGFAPDRGFARAFVGRAGYTIDTNRSVAFESVVRQDGKGVWAKLEYSQAFGQHWRATAGVALIRGSSGDFLGQYRRNSHGIFALRYSF